MKQTVATKERGNFLKLLLSLLLLLLLLAIILRVVNYLTTITTTAKKAQNVSLSSKYTIFDIFSLIKKGQYFGIL